MSGLVVQARAPRAAHTLDALRARIEGLDGDPPPRFEIHDGRLYATLHPFAEAMELAIEGDRVAIRAHTGSAGPGYHDHVCRVLRGLALDAMIVEDPTGYFASGDRGALEEELLDRVSASAAHIVELASGGAHGFAIGLPDAHRFQHDGLVATAMGPRTEAWLRGLADDPAAGRDVYVWWSPERDAAYYRGLALSAMWCEVRWRAPMDDEERELLDRVATWVERAHGLDPEIDLPWSEQAELLGLLDESSLRATRAQLKAQAAPPRTPIGYRRRPVRVRLSGGWSIEIDGACAERWDERGVFVAHDERRSLHVSTCVVTDTSGRPSPDAAATLEALPALEGDEVLAFEAGPMRGLAAIGRAEDEGIELLRVEAYAAVGAHAAIGTLVSKDTDDRDWALEAWASLRR
ncbi:MAG: hypothetical protein AB7S26_05415 [Sandaracinaceae bacterium]